ncbi:MAG: phenylalanine--tRNA ligase subunit alpha [Holophagales bacterium]|nr:phenylalanine--tRNA ligase subunit alpha [Holophagales bacterium]
MAATALEDLTELRSRFDQQTGEVRDPDGWEDLRVEWAGRKNGRLKALMGRMKEIPGDRKREYGQAVNELKQHVENRLEELRSAIASTSADPSPELDVTLPGRRPRLGSLHPVTLVTREIEAIFAELGYSVAEGPEIESDFHNFEALNFPPGHPARETQDTFFFDNGLLLRTHTSPVQIRTMLEREAPPIRVICPGRVYRNDNDLRHSPMFHQVECLAVDEGISLGDLKGTLEAFLKRLFSPSTRVRLRPSFFPFTEPSAEVDVTCSACGGSGCATCSHTGWMEILGCGMVDPRVLRNCGIDPDRYSGFAFGLGLDRVAMIRYGIPNIRTLFDNDQRLLRQVRA